VILDEDLIVQSTNSLERIKPVDQIVITTNLPVRPELTSTQVNNLTTSIASKVTSKTLTSFKTIPTDGSPYYSGYFVAEPEQNWVNLGGLLDVKEVTLTWYWEDYDGNTYPIELPVQCSAGAKL